MATALYGVHNVDAAVSAAVIEQLLGCSLEQRESDYLGIYWRGSVRGIEVRVVSQPDPSGDSLEDEFPEFRTLIYVDGETIPEGLETNAIAGEIIQKLRQEN